MAEKSVKEEWAVMVNVTEPVKDFHKRVPDMAHKVRALYSFVSVSLFSSSIFYLELKRKEDHRSFRRNFGSSEKKAVK